MKESEPTPPEKEREITTDMMIRAAIGGMLIGSVVGAVGDIIYHQIVG